MKKYFFLLILIYTNQLLAQNNNATFTKTQSGLLNGANVFTIEFFVKTTNTQSNNMYWQRPFLFGNVTNGDNSGDFGITINNGFIGMFCGASSLNTDQQFLSNSIKINDNFYHHIAAVNNGQTINLYVDGNIVGSIISGRGLSTTNAPLTFGAATLDFSFAGNTPSNVNFISQSSFGEARISNMVRYASNFSPPQSLPTDNNSTAVFRLDNQANVYTNTDINTVAVFNAEALVDNRAAQAATLYLKDSSTLNGRLLIAKKDWSLKNELGIRFFENGSKKAKFYKTDEVLGFQMGNSYYESKKISNHGSTNVPTYNVMVKRLTDAGAKMDLYTYSFTEQIKNSNGFVEYKNTKLYLVQLPNTKDDVVYQFSDSKFAPHFDTRVSEIVKDNTALADKIRNKDKDYFYQFITNDTNRYKVWINIILEYNKK
jgi:Concanavalin A-like lectin/glucanases superfamily